MDAVELVGRAVEGGSDGHLYADVKENTCVEGGSGNLLVMTATATQYKFDCKFQEKGKGGPTTSIAQSPGRDSLDPCSTSDHSICNSSAVKTASDINIYFCWSHYIKTR